MAKIGSFPIGRVVSPRPVTWNVTFHQWLRRGAAASRIFPTTWVNRWRVSLVGSHDAYDRSGQAAGAARPGFSVASIECLLGASRAAPYRSAALWTVSIDQVYAAVDARPRPQEFRWEVTR